MKYILFVLAIFALAILASQEARKLKRYEAFYFEKLTTDLAMTEYYLIDTLDSYPSDSLVNRLHEINTLLNDK